MYAYCENNPANKFDQTGDFALTATLGGIALWKIGAAIIGMVTALVLVDSLVKNPPTFSTITIDAKPKAEAKDKTRDITLSNSRRDPIHHNVAKADPRAAESRKILRDVGIEPVTDMRNLVTLPQSYHVSLHTTAYHNYRWNYAFWRHNETPIIEANNEDEGMKILFEWYEGKRCK